MRCTWPTIIAATGITLATAIPAASAASAVPGSPASAPAPLKVRINQVGYPADGPKVAYAMLAKPVSKVSFEITTPFNTKTAGYEDNVVSWPSVEPADDYTAASLFAFALGAAGLG